MNNLANKSRFRLSTELCRKLFFLLFWFSCYSAFAQDNVESICTNVDVNVFDEIYVDNIAKANFNYEGHADTICFSDVSSNGECTWNDFNGHFDISQWWFKADNHDGYLHTEEIPYSVAIEGARHSPRNNYKRYVASLKTIAPAAGFVAFDWESYGGDFYNIDAFYFTINDSCVQLTRTDITKGHFVSWMVAEGDTISLEQTSNGTSNHITTSISNFQFIPKEYKIIDRTWKVVDHYQDTSKCLQRITILRPGLEDFHVPINHDGYDQDFLACDGNARPEWNHFPYYVGLRDTHYLSEAPTHYYSATYIDKVASACGGNKTLSRKWTIKDHCSGASITKTQIIKKKDFGPIEMRCPADQTFNISKCAVSVYIRQPRAWTSCNENIHVDIDWAYGSGSKVYSNVAPGRYEIKFTARDGCGLEKVCSMWLNLVYDGGEAVTCKSSQTFSLPANGQLNIPVSDLVTRNTNSCSGDLRFEIDGNEYLNLDCDDIGWKTYAIRYFDPLDPYDYQTCQIDIEVIGDTGSVTCKEDQYYTLPSTGHLRIPVKDLVETRSSSCSPNLQFEINGSEYLELDCEDIGWKSYTIRYFDPSNPSDYQTCSVGIELGGSGGSITCPSDVTISCSDDISNLDIYGSISLDGVAESSVIYIEDRNLSSCGVGYITRTWSFDSSCGGYQTCSQRIDIEGSLGNVIVEWPDDYITDACGGTLDLTPESLPTGFDRPRMSSNQVCGEITFSYIDSGSSGDQFCYEILRTWTAVNSCDPAWRDSYSQRLEVRDTQLPTIVAPSDQRIYNNSAACEGSYVTLAKATVMDCDPTVTVSHDSPYASSTGSDASGTYPAGVTEVTFTATDRCGNQATAKTIVEVISNGDPSLTCIGELEVNLTEDGYGNVNYLLSASQLITSVDNSCNGSSYIYSFSENVSDVSLVLTCSDLGLKSVDVYRYNGTSWDNCQAWISVQDDQNKCSSGAAYASVSGKITTEDGKDVKYVNIDLEVVEDVNTDDNGDYVVENIPTGINYTIRPVKEINVRNGISTLDMVMLNRHLLGLRFIESPYQILACDINNNQAVTVGDLYRMNALVLGTTQELEPSWKFVRSDYIFPDPTNPFVEPIPGHIDINLQEDVSNLDFIAVKIGDPNNSANPRRLDWDEGTASAISLEAAMQSEENEVVDLKIIPPSNGLIDGLQFTLEFDPMELSYMDALHTFGLNPDLVINDSRIDEGKLGVVFVNYTQKQALEPLELRFRNLSGSSLSSLEVTASNGIYEAEGYVADKIHPLELKWKAIGDENLTFDVAPNPFHESVQLEILSDRNLDVNMSIIDITGKIITNRNTHLLKGSNTYTLRRTDFENAGIYVIKLSSSTISRWKRVVLID